MTINPPRGVRVALYVVALVVTPLVVYGQAKGWVDDAAAALVGAYLVVINGLAAANVPTRGQVVDIAAATDDQPGEHRAT